MGKNETVGSTWKKWDLHVHTPCSIFQKYGGDTAEAWERFFVDLESLPPEFKVIGVNDYIFVDGYEIVLRAKRAGRLANIDLVLPVLEFRLDKFGGVVLKQDDGTYSPSEWSRLNLHVIFDELEPEVIRQQFLPGLAREYRIIPEAGEVAGTWRQLITRQSLAELGQMLIDAAPQPERRRYGTPLVEGFNNLCTSLEDVLDALSVSPLQGRYLLALGKTEWENLRWTDGSIAEKRHVISKVDFVFTAAATPEAYEISRARLKAANVNSKLLDCSDAHAFSESTDKDRIGNCGTWIKADSTFEGLRQAATEFEQRVQVGMRPRKLDLVSAGPTKYISAITISKKPDSGHPSKWFDVSLPLNHDLVAVIGNKGSGKSALADSIALAGATRNFQRFSFLTRERFRDPKAKLASHYHCTLHWSDAPAAPTSLDLDPAPSEIERVKYLPQSYLESLCNEIGGGGSATFDKELRKIIFTHVEPGLKVDHATLDDLIHSRVEESRQKRSLLRAKLSEIHERISRIEERLEDTYRAALIARLELRKRDLATLVESRPPEVENPAESPTATKLAAEHVERIHDLTQVIVEIDAELREATEFRDGAVAVAARIEHVFRQVRSVGAAFADFKVNVEALLARIPGAPAFEEIADLQLTTNSLEALQERVKGDIAVHSRRIEGDEPDSLRGKRLAAVGEISELRGRLSEKQRQFEEYRAAQARWHQDLEAIEGPESREGTIAALQSEIENLSTLPGVRAELIESRRDLVRRLHLEIRAEMNEYSRLYEPVEKFAATIPELGMDLPLSFRVQILEGGFQDAFFSRINRQARGSFSGVDESSELLAGLLRETSFDQEASTLEFVERIFEMLHEDQRPGHEGKTVPSEQLRRGQTPASVYDYVFGLDYVQPMYTLAFGGEEISKLSPGERGLLLLVFYLLVDNDDIPLVIDQPEENLDNQTIFSVLVAAIKAAKARRQIIMVTHNPNLAVVCDSEQIVCASCDKAASEFSYDSGAIENPKIRARVVEVLEGTAPAFINRQRKYKIS